MKTEQSGKEKAKDKEMSKFQTCLLYFLIILFCGVYVGLLVWIIVKGVELIKLLIIAYLLMMKPIRLAIMTSTAISSANAS